MNTTTQRTAFLIRFIWLLVASLLFVHTVYGQKTITDHTFHIEGQIAHFGDGIIVGSILNAETNTVRLDTIHIKNDTFSHNGIINNKQIVRYEVGNDRFSRYRKVVKDGDSIKVDFADKRLKAVEVVLYPGVKVKINGIAASYLSAYPSGDVDNDLLAWVNRKRYPLLSEIGNLDYSNKQTFRQVLHKEAVLVDFILAAENQCINSHPESVVSSYIVMDRFKQFNKRSPKKADSLLTLLKPSKYDLYYRNMLKEQQSRSGGKALKVGDVFPDFSSRTVYNDSVFNLATTRGKYRLIDFWGTWCIPCVHEMPRLKEFYEKYKAEVIVIGIANDTYQRWTTFLNKNAYRWIQIMDRGPVKLADKIMVEVYPTKYLLDPDGKIILIVKDAQEDLWNRIEGLIDDQNLFSR